MKERIIISDLNKTDIEKIQHINRYEIQSKYASGKVLDIACGIGYGSKIILKNSKVINYLGGDISPEAIKEANKNFSNDKSHFEIMDISKIPFEENKFNFIISNETLEHLKNPNKAVSEISRVLDDNGIFTGTVPSKFYDEYFEKQWKIKNKYHLIRFTKKKLINLLSKNFKYITILSCTEDVVTRLNKIYSNNKNKNKIHLVKAPNYKNIMGSYLFIATKKEHPIHQIQDGFFMGFNYVVHIKKTYDNIINIKDIYIKTLEKGKLTLTNILNDKDRYIKELEKSKFILNNIIQNKIKDKYIKKLEKSKLVLNNIIEDKNKYIKDMENSRKIHIKSIEEKNQYIIKLEKMHKSSIKTLEQKINISKNDK